jgi:hypothetical protein
MPNERARFLDVVHDPISELIAWNAPDHEHTRHQVRAWIEEALAEAFAVYENFGGDAAQGLAPAPGPKDSLPAASAGAKRGDGDGLKGKSPGAVPTSPDTGPEGGE